MEMFFGRLFMKIDILHDKDEKKFYCIIDDIEAHMMYQKKNFLNL